jgi:hypothetical protein
MAGFSLIQILDMHLSPRVPRLVQNFLAVSDYINASWSDLVINTGDLAFDAPDHPDKLTFAYTEHARLTVP